MLAVGTRANSEEIDTERQRMEVGEFEAGEKALRQVIQLHPEYDHLHRNLQFYA